MWNDNGVTFKRVALNQSATVPVWGGNQPRVPFTKFEGAGFLRRILLEFPRTQYGMTITASNPLSVSNAEAQLPALRAIQSLSLTLQRVAPIVQLGKGEDLAQLEYMNCGRSHLSHGINMLGQMASLTATNTTVLGKASAAWDYIGSVVSVSSASGTAQNVQFGLHVDLPLTEHIRFPSGFVSDAKGNQVAVPSTQGEVGLISIQNPQQNFIPAMTLNPFWVASGDSGVFTQSATAPSNQVSPVINLWTEFYDVPENPADWPPGYSFAYVIQYSSSDDPVTAGKVTHKFDNAGMLMRACYVAYNGDAIVDLSKQSPDGEIQFVWGTSVIHRDESLQVNLTNNGQLYGSPPLFGALYHDFFTETKGLTDMVDTARTASPRAIISGLPSSVTNLHTIEQRMIPVAVRR